MLRVTEKKFYHPFYLSEITTSKRLRGSTFRCPLKSLFGYSVQALEPTLTFNAWTGVFTGSELPGEKPAKNYCLYKPLV